MLMRHMPDFARIMPWLRFDNNLLTLMLMLLMMMMMMTTTTMTMTMMVMIMMMIMIMMMTMMMMMMMLMVMVLVMMMLMLLLLQLYIVFLQQQLTSSHNQSNSGFSTKVKTTAPLESNFRSSALSGRQGWQGCLFLSDDAC